MNPVFVIGFPRSGTTLLLHLLMSSGEFPTYRFSESHFFSHCYRRYGSLDRESNRALLLAELEARDWFNGTDVSREQLEARIGEENTEYEAYLRHFMALVAESQGKERWIEKTPWHYHYTKEIRRAFPNSRFLIMVRDPRDVVLSITKYGWTTNTPNRMLRTAIAWAWAMRLVRRLFSPPHGDFVFIRYEDLVSDPEKVLDAINALLGLKLDLTALSGSEFGVMAASNSSFGEGDRGIHTASVGRWKKNLPDDLARQMNFVLRGIADSFGYVTNESPRPPLPTRIKLRAMQLVYGTAKRSRRILFPLMRR